jgi:ParB family chromosome partitioning protein
MEPTAHVLDIPLEDIHLAVNDRRTFDPKEMAALVASIEAEGLVQPIVVRPLLVGYELIAGERRLRAHQIIGAPTISAVVRSCDDSGAQAAMLVENMVRVDLSPIEEANAYAKRIAAGATVEDVAVTAGVAAFRVRWRLDLLTLAADIQPLVNSGALATGYARTMCGLDTNRQHLALKALQHDLNMTAGEFRSVCAHLRADQDQEAIFDAGDFLRNEEWVAKARKVAKASRPRLFQLLAAATEYVPDELAADIAAAVAAEPEVTWKPRHGMRTP